MFLIDILHHKIKFILKNNKTFFFLVCFYSLLFTPQVRKDSYPTVMKMAKHMTVY